MKIINDNNNNNTWQMFIYINKYWGLSNANYMHFKKKRKKRSVFDWPTEDIKQGLFSF